MEGSNTREVVHRIRRPIRDLGSTFLSFFKIGAFTIGGGLAMLPLIEEEFVNRKKWVTHLEILDVFAVAQSLPGVIAINASIFVGYKVDGIRGSIVATLGVILPSFLSILAIASLLVGFQDNPWVQRAFGGIRSGVTALIFFAGIKLGRAVLKTKFAWGLAIATTVGIAILRLPVVWVILGSAILGLLRQFWSRGRV